MIREAASVGRLAMQLVFFSGGLERSPRCSASAWISDPLRFAQLMAKVKCKAGYTQITRALRHARDETRREKVAAVVLIGDMCKSAEDDLDRVAQVARELGTLKTPVFAFLEGRDPIAEKGFRTIAKLSNGAFGISMPAASNSWASSCGPRRSSRLAAGERSRAARPSVVCSCSSSSRAVLVMADDAGAACMPRARRGLRKKPAEACPAGPAT